MQTKKIKSKTRINAEVEIPGSKSYTNRALIISALADGKSELENTLLSDDTRYMMEALGKFGVKMQVEELTKKEVHQCLRAKVAVEKAKLDLNGRLKEGGIGKYGFKNTSFQC